MRKADLTPEMLRVLRVMDGGVRVSTSLREAAHYKDPAIETTYWANLGVPHPQPRPQTINALRRRELIEWHYDAAGITDKGRAALQEQE